MKGGKDLKNQEISNQYIDRNGHTNLITFNGCVNPHRLGEDFYTNTGFRVLHDNGGLSVYKDKEPVILEARYEDFREMLYGADDGQGFRPIKMGAEILLFAVGKKISEPAVRDKSAWLYRKMGVAFFKEDEKGNYIGLNPWDVEMLKGFKERDAILKALVVNRQVAAFPVSVMLPLGICHELFHYMKNYKPTGGHEQ